MKTILIMGLPDSGKTTLSQTIKDTYNGTVCRLNADEVRAAANDGAGDWDFSKEGRIRQSKRMADLAKEVYEMNMTLTEEFRDDFIIVDFICPTKETRKLFNADITIWMDTVKESKFEDTNKIFEPPSEEEVDYHILTQDAEFWAETIIKDIHEK
jgi:adenylylsulfate kinase